MNKTKIFALGGLGEVGKNTYCIEHNNEIIIIDAGLKFPNKYFLNINYIIPDYQYLVKNKHKVKGLFITHGHEDHIGGIPFLVKAINLKNIYSPEFASDLIKLKIKKSPVNVINYKKDSVINFKNFKVSFFAITHSIPYSFGISVKTPNGTIVNTGDFKLDWTPLGQKTEINKISELGKNGVDLLLSDSTNSEISGYTLTEQVIISNIAKIFEKNPKKRIFITTFASNMNRIIQIILAAEKINRKIVILGRSIDNVMKIFKEKKYFKINFKNLITIDHIKKHPPEKILVICTGSQGEPNSAINKMANNNHPKISITKNDLFIFSSKPIPGNRYSIDNVINKLRKFNAAVKIDTKLERVHTSGHASQEEQKIILSLLKPKYFLPAHGEYRMLKAHKTTALSLGIPEENIFIIPNGQQLELFKHKIQLGGKVPAQPIFIGNNPENNEDLKTLNERQILLTGGVINVVCFYDNIQKKINNKTQYLSFGVAEFKKDYNFIQELNHKIDQIGQQREFNHLIPREREKRIENMLFDEFYKIKKINPLIKVCVLE